MTIGAGISVADGKLMVLGNCVLRDVYDNVEVIPASRDAFLNGAFIGVRSEQVGSLGSSLLEHLREVVYLPKDTTMPMTLKSQEYEVLIVVPVKELSNGAKFAPIGLIKMFNSRRAIKDLKYDYETSATVDMKVRGCGLFGAYSSASPKRIRVDYEEVELEYEEGYGLVTFDLRVLEEELYLWNIVVEL